MQSFKRIRKNSRNGLGIVYVQRDACGGCFNKIPPQRQLDIRSRKKVIVCEYCGRIMIDPELAGVQLEHKVEEAPAPTTKEQSEEKQQNKRLLFRYIFKAPPDGGAFLYSFLNVSEINKPNL